MAKITFRSPKEMIGAGIVLVILGVIFLAFGIGYIGALFGIWWIIRGTYWQIKVSQAKGKVKLIKQGMQKCQDAVEFREFSKAVRYALELSNDKNISYEYKEHFSRDAAFYSILADDLDKAEDYNNDQRFDNYEDPDYHNIYAIIYELDGETEEANKTLTYVRQLNQRGRYFEIASKVVSNKIPVNLLI